MLWGHPALGVRVAVGSRAQRVALVKDPHVGAIATSVGGGLTDPQFGQGEVGSCGDSNGERVNMCEMLQEDKICSYTKQTDTFPIPPNRQDLPQYTGLGLGQEYLGYWGKVKNKQRKHLRLILILGQNARVLFQKFLSIYSYLWSAV